jgi:uncharacterized membrane protein required for colicin V production
VNWIDLVIVVIVALAALRGFARGAVRQVLSLAGLVAGFYLSARVAPSLSRHVSNTSWRPGVALGIVIVGSLLGGFIGEFVGSIIAKTISVMMLGIVDRTIGIVVGAIEALVGCWLIAGLLVSTTWASLASEIQHSRILASIDKVMPPIPSVEADVQNLFRSGDFPSVFAKVVAPSLQPPINPHNLGPLVTSLSQPSAVEKVIASGGCNTDSQGTGFYVTTDEVLTNAHVVAGHDNITVGGAPAQVALYDPENDLAVLRVPSARHTPLHFLASTPAPRTPVHVVGFPLNATRTRASGYVEGEISAQSRDIYNQSLRAREFLVLEVNVNPGNSGSPVFEGSHVVGVLESKSVSQQSTAYAIPYSVVRVDLAHVPSAGVASTQSCMP